MLYISPYSAQMRENADQNNSKYGHFLRSGEDGNKLIVNSYFASRYIYGPWINHSSTTEEVAPIGF